VRPATYIYEFDFKGYFDSVPVYQVLDDLFALGLSGNVRAKLLEMAKCPPLFPNGPSVDEFVKLKQTEYNELKRVYHHSSQANLYSGRPGSLVSRAGTHVKYPRWFTFENLRGIDF